MVFTCKFWRRGFHDFSFFGIVASHAKHMCGQHLFLQRGVFRTARRDMSTPIVELMQTFGARYNIGDDETIKQCYFRNLRAAHPDKHHQDKTKELTGTFQARYPHMKHDYAKLKEYCNYVVNPSLRSLSAPLEYVLCDDNNYRPKLLLQVEKEISESLQWKNAKDLVSPCGLPKVGDVVRTKCEGYWVTVVKKEEAERFQVLVLHTTLGMSHDGRKHTRHLVDIEAHKVCSRVCVVITLDPPKR
jgi:hypothetical protein